MHNSIQLSRTKKISSLLSSGLQHMIKKTLVIVPCYNEEKNIEKAIKQLVDKTKLNFLIVDDCSTDKSLKIINKNKWNHIKNETNLGLSKTFANGVKWAKNEGYEYVVQYDGDGQHNPEDILSMLVYASKGYDIVLSSRYYSKNNLTSSKKIAHKILNFLFKLKTKQIITDSTCGLRIYNWVVMDEFINNSKMEVEPASIAYVTKKKSLKIKEVPTIVFEREHGIGSFNKKSKIIKYMTKQIFRLTFLFLNRGKKND